MLYQCDCWSRSYVYFCIFHSTISSDISTTSRTSLLLVCVTNLPSIFHMTRVCQVQLLIVYALHNSSSIPCIWTSNSSIEHTPIIRAVRQSAVGSRQLCFTVRSHWSIRHHRWCPRISETWDQWVSNAPTARLKDRQSTVYHSKKSVHLNASVRQ